MYKLLSIDLDGTLLNNKGQISKKNKQAILKLQEKDIKVIFNSGRIKIAMQDYIEECNLNSYVISGNGTTIHDIKNDKEIFECKISKQRILEIIDICEKRNIYYCIYGKNEIIASKMEHHVKYYYHRNQEKKDEYKININIVKDIKKYIEKNPSLYFSKVTIADKDKNVFKKIIDTFNSMKDLQAIDVQKETNRVVKIDGKREMLKFYYTDIIPKEVNKWKTLLKLIEMLNIQQQEVVAIGDDKNDYEMIQNAGLGIAVWNAEASIKKIADHVVKENDESGVAEAIYRYVLK